MAHVQLQNPNSDFAPSSYPLLPSLLLPMSLWPLAGSRYIRQCIGLVVGARWRDSEVERLQPKEELDTKEDPRTIKRLRAQNELLKEMLAQCRKDLECERGVREVTHRCHERYVEELRGRNELLEVRVEDLRREVLALQYGNESTLGSGWLEFKGEHDEKEDDRRKNRAHQGCVSYTSDFNHDDFSLESDSDSDFSSTPDPAVFTTTALEHLTQSVLNNLTPAMAILHFDDLVLKFDPPVADILSVLARAVQAWCARVPALVGLAERWGGILGRYVPDTEGKYFLIQLEVAFTDTSETIVKRVWMRLLIELYQLDIVGGDEVIAWAKCGEGGLRVSCGRFLEFLEREDDDDDDDDDDNEEDDVDVEDGEPMSSDLLTSATLSLFLDDSCSCAGERACDFDHDSGCDISDEGSVATSIVGESTKRERKCVRFSETCVRKFGEGDEKDIPGF